MDNGNPYTSVHKTLRELLLWADETGSVTIDYILDPGHLPDVHGSVLDHRGAALLVCTYPIVLAAQSSRLAKLQKLLKTIDPCYFRDHSSWTDGPSIFTGRTLARLQTESSWTVDSNGEEAFPSSAHRLWVHVDQPGARVATRMFEILNHSLDQHFPGTVLRIPLQESPCATGCVAHMVDRLAHALKEFKMDIRDCLLFTKNLMSITLRLSGDIFGEAHVTGGNKRPIVDAFSKAQSCTGSEVTSFSLDVLLRFNDIDTSSQTQWSIVHCLRQLTPEQASSAGVHMVPFLWIGLAAQSNLEHGDDNKDPTICGRWFDILPYPEVTGQPVHIHSRLVGTFCDESAPNKSKQPYHEELSGYQERKNTVLRNMLPYVWAELLMAMSLQKSATGDQLLQQSAEYSNWQNWPMPIIKNVQEGKLQIHILKETAQFILENNYSVWPSSEGYMVCKDLLFTQAMPDTFDIKIQSKHFERMRILYRSLSQVKIPISFVPGHIFEIIEDMLPPWNILTPLAVSNFLKRSPNMAMWDSTTRGCLLEYLTRPIAGVFDHLIGLELLPTCDGAWKSLDYLTAVKLPMNDVESYLFGQQGARTIDCSRLPGKVLRKLRSIAGQTTIHPWRIKDAVEYCKETYFVSIPEDTSQVPIEQLSSGYTVFLRGFWEWIISKYVYKEVAMHLKEIWVVPILGGHLRRPVFGSDMPILEPGSGSVGKLLMSAATNYLADYAIYDCTILSSQATSLLRENAIILHSENFLHLLEWLKTASDAVSSMPGWMREELCKNIATLATPLYECTGEVSPQAVAYIKKLQIFQEIRNNLRGTTLNWTTLEKDVTYVVVGWKDVVPELEGVIFLSDAQEAVAKVYKMFQLAVVPDSEVLMDYAIRGLSSTSSVSIAERLAGYVMQNLHCLSHDMILALKDIPFVPANARAGKSTVEWLMKPQKCVDSRSEAAKLFFDQEFVWIPDRFLGRFRKQLLTLGIIHEITPELIEERAASYAHTFSSTSAYPGVIDKAQMLIQIGSSMKLPTSLALRSERWLPVTLQSGEVVLFDASMCRDRGFQEIVGYAIGIISCPIGPSWVPVLGWDEDIPATFIRRQVEAIVEKKELPLLVNLLEYVCSREGYYEVLKDLKWLPGSSGKLFLPQNIFFGDYEILAPFCDRLWGPLLIFREFLKKLGASETPSFSKLARVLSQLANEGNSSIERSQKSIAILTLTVELYPAADFSKIMAPDRYGVFHLLTDLTAGEPQLCDIDVSFVHQDLPSKVIESLRIPQLSARKSSSLEDEVQATYDCADAKAIVHRIRSSLSRFELTDLFTEFLGYANSMSNASKVEWILDPGTREEVDATVEDEAMGRASFGPSLFFVTDGVMGADVRREFINIASGYCNCMDRHADGILTMYLWSSTPRLISSDTYVLFNLSHDTAIEARKEPQFVTLEATLSKMRKQRYNAQLHQFHGIASFEQDIEKLEATILMLPIFTPAFPADGSSLYSGINFTKANDLLESYQSIADIGLLSLENISQIGFSIRGKGMQWSMVKQDLTVEEEIEDKTSICLCDIKSTKAYAYTSNRLTNTWVISQRYLPATVPEDINHPHADFSLRKCRIAAKLPPLYARPPGQHYSPLSGTIFSFLPARFSSNLPVHIQAPFQTLQWPFIAEDGINSWDSWVIEEIIVPLYMELLQYLATACGESAHYFWPAPEIESSVLACRIGESLWNRVPTSPKKLFAVRNFPHVSSKYYYKTDDSVCCLWDCIAFSDATFDLLADDMGAVLRPLLQQLGARKVVRPTSTMARELTRIDAIADKTVSPILLQDMLKSPSGLECLLKYWVQEEYSCQGLNVVLDFVLNGGREPGRLIGCPIIPLLNGNIGILGDKRSFYSSISELASYSLFEYSPERALHTGLKKGVVATLIELNCNVRLMALLDVPQIFSNVSAMDLRTERFYSFLDSVWAFIHLSSDGGSSRDQQVLAQLPIHRARIGEESCVLTPQQFESLPAIIAPDIISPEGKLCSKLSGIYLISPSTFFRTRIKEEMLHEPVGFVRFIRALSKLAFIAHQPANSFCSENFKVEDSLFLRDLVKDVLQKLEESGRLSHSLLNMLRELPLWPNHHGKLINASKAILAPDSRLVLPWMQLDDMILNSELLENMKVPLNVLTVKVMGVPAFVERYMLPRTRMAVGEFMDEEMDRYTTFLRALFELKPAELPQWPLAVDGLGKFRNFGQLYNPSNHVFKCAFRGDSARFLHPSLRSLSGWDWVGFLRDEVHPKDFLACAKQIHLRSLLLEGTGIKQPVVELQSDSRLVYSFLLGNWDSPGYDVSFWRQLSSICFIPSKKEFSEFPIFRRMRMKHIANRMPLSCLNNCILPLYADVCWSQCILYETAPSTDMMRKTFSKGLPSADSVLNHLRYLSQNWNSTIDLVAYIVEITATYSFLNDHAAELTQSSLLREENIICNLEIDEITVLEKDRFRSCWVSAQEVCVGIRQDYGGLKYVRTLLDGYVPFLEALGAKVIKLPKSIIREQRKFWRPNEKIHELWLRGRLCDVEITVNSQSFKVHRLILASCSGYWERAFTGAGRVGNFDVSDCLTKAVPGILRYMYTGSIEMKPEKSASAESTQKLLDWLTLAHEWDMPVLQNELEVLFSQGRMLTPENVRATIAVAGKLKMEDLAEYCTKYIAENKSLVDQADWEVRKLIRMDGAGVVPDRVA